MPLYFFEGRNTGIYAESAAAARKKKKRGGDKIVKTLNKAPPKNGAWDRIVKTLNKAPPKNGAWDRTRKDGKSPAKSAHGKGRGMGPPRKKKT